MLAFVGTTVRHFLGIKVMSLYVYILMSFVVAFSVSNNSVVSLIIGSISIIITYILSYYVKRLANDAGLHYFARVSVVLGLVSLLIFSVIFTLDIFLDGDIKNVIEMFNALILIMIVVLCEYFASNQTQKGIKKSRVLFINTLIISILTGSLISWTGFEKFLLNNAYISFIALVMIFIVGRYTGFRINELFRFNDISSESKND